MATHRNPSITERLARIFNTKSFDSISDQVADYIQPVLSVEPLINNIATSSQSTSSASNTILTLPSSKDFYLCGLSASYVKDATCDAADGSFSISVTVDGVSKVLFQFPLLTLTSQTDAINIVFPKAIKCDRGSTLSVATPTFTVGKFRRAEAFYGYMEEN